MKEEYDPKTDSAYIRLTNARVLIAETTELSEDVLVDYDHNGRPVGIEILNATEVLPGKVLHYLQQSKATA